MPRPFVIQDLHTDEDWARAYLAVCDSLCVHHAAAFDAVHESFLEGLKTNMNMNLDVGDTEMQIGKTMMRETILSILALIFEGAALFLVLRYGTKPVLRLAGRTVKAGVKGVRSGIRAGLTAGRQKDPTPDIVPLVAVEAPPEEKSSDTPVLPVTPPSEPPAPPKAG